MPAAELGRRLRERDVTVAPAVLNLVERRTPAGREDVAALLHEVSPAVLGGEAPGYVVGVTGPPGRGSRPCWASSWPHGGARAARSRCSPSIRPRAARAAPCSGTEREFPPSRATAACSSAPPAAGERLGGLAPATRAAAQSLAAAFDVVVIETVGVGQSETEVADVADTVAVVVQPGSGDVLQFLKAGIMEIPDLLVVTKADPRRRRAAGRRDLLAALRALGSDAEVVMVSSVPPAQGFDELMAALERHRERLDLPARRTRARRRAALADFVAEHGDRGLRALGGRRVAERWLDEQAAGLDVPALTRRARAARAGGPVRKQGSWAVDLAIMLGAGALATGSRSWPARRTWARR
jgi:LAO/AO transport system kinase